MDYKAEAKRICARAWGARSNAYDGRTLVVDIAAALEAADASAEERTRVHYEALLKEAGVEVIECPDCAGRTPTPDNCYFGDCSCHGRRYHIRNTDAIAAEKRGRVAGLREAAVTAEDLARQYAEFGATPQAEALVTHRDDLRRRAEEVERS